MTCILGIDPGSRKTGFGVIQIHGQRMQYIDAGVISTQGKDFPQRLGQIFRSIADVVDAHPIQEVAIEQVFLARNPSSAIKLGQARGAAIAAVTCRELPLAEYSAREVKKAIVGYGAADKSQMQHMVRRLLNLHCDIQEDAADALAIAMCHAQMRSMRARIAAQLEKQATGVCA